jgi:hypothetical protein
MCGACSGSATCFANRCYHSFGPPPSFPPALAKGLFSSPEGERCTVNVDGTLERVEAVLWSVGCTAITMDVYVSCGAQLVKAATVSLSCLALPGYTGTVNEPAQSTTFVLDPPVALKKGDLVQALFRAEGAEAPTKGAVSGLYLNDEDHGCAHTGYDLNAEPPVNDGSDYMARFYIH